VPGADVDYTFGQVSVNTPLIDYGGTCGNISPAVGPFAIEEGLVGATDPMTTVRIWQTNTRRDPQDGFALVPASVWPESL